MPYLIDGHNLIPKIPGLDLHDIDDEIALIRMLKDFCRRRGVKATVYFDNAPPGSTRTKKFGRVTAYFVRQGRTADDAIRVHLQKLGHAARNWTVVTSDREVAASSKAAGAKVLTSERFSNRFLPEEEAADSKSGTKTNMPLTPEAIEEWMQLFGTGDETS
jgi:predicted RNA-binding protein with PIN domain